MKGIDVYHGNGSVDWPKVAAAGYSFAFIKATQGTSFTDPKFKANISASQKAGLKIGAYHFANFSNPASARAEAQHFAATVKGAKLDLALALDLEVNHAGNQLSVSMQAFFDELKKIDGRAMVLYSFGVFYLDYLAGHHPGIPLWYARYANSPIGVSIYGAWQHRSDAHVPGIAGLVDEDLAGSAWDDLVIGDPIAVPKSPQIVPKKINPIPTVSYYVTADRLNIRSTPDMKHKAIGQLKHGDRIQVISISGGWAQLKSGSQVVYVDNDFISRSLATQKPVVKPEPVIKSHIVQTGDKVSKLARENGVSIAQIKSWNHLNSKYIIYKGQKLIVKKG